MARSKCMQNVDRVMDAVVAIKDVVMRVLGNRYVAAGKDLATDEGTRSKATNLTTQLKNELSEVLCLKNKLGVHAKRSVSCSQIFSLLMLFLLGSIAGNIVLLQSTVMLFAD